MAQPAFSDQVTQIQRNLEEIYERMNRAAEKSGRKGSDIQLVAVTKLMPLETIRAGIAAGLRAFGENYPEQAAEKISALRTEHDLTWHMIGHIQSRKTSTVCEFFDWVHSVDRMKIARYLDRYSREADRVMPVLLEVNLSGEGSKHGWPAWDEESWPKLVPQFAEIAQFSYIEVRGLMTMPRLFENEELTRPYYQRLRRMQKYLQKALPDVNWTELSIGTSFDYEVAIEEGATMVRLGTTLFGPRPAN